MRLPLALVLLSSTAFAGEFKETLPKAEIRAISEAIQKNLPPVDKAAVPTCQALLDEYNKDPDNSVDKVFEAATCFRAAGSLGSAIRMFQLYQTYGKDKAKQRDALRALADTHEAAAFFWEAASENEQFARKYAGEKDAKERMVRAACIRRQLGDDREAKADGAYLERMPKGKITADDALCLNVRPIVMPAKK